MKNILFRWFVVVLFYTLIWMLVPLVFNHVGVWFAFGYVILLIAIIILISERIGKFLGVNNDEK